MSSSTGCPLNKIVGDQLAAAPAPVFAEKSGASVEIIDLAELALPVLDEPLTPALGNYQKPHTIAWSESIKDSDAMVFRRRSATLATGAEKAVDYLYHEWPAKRAFIVSHGGHGGIRAEAQLRSVLEVVGWALWTAMGEPAFPRHSPMAPAGISPTPGRSSPATRRRFSPPQRHVARDCDMADEPVAAGAPVAIESCPVDFLPGAWRRRLVRIGTNTDRPDPIGRGDQSLQQAAEGSVRRLLLQVVNQLRGDAVVRPRGQRQQA